MFPGPQVKLGGNKASGAKRMYFVLVHTVGSQAGRISAPPMLPRTPLAPPSPANSDLVAAAAAATPARGVADDPFADCGGGDDDDGDGDSRARGGGGGNELNQSRSSRRKGGVAVESKEDQVFGFWDEKANGKLVQAPLDLDRHGRGWCQVGSFVVHCF